MAVSASALIVLPARRGSTRLSDKLLLRATGKPLLQHTIERALEAAALAGQDSSGRSVQVWVACDDQELAAVAAHCGVGAILVTEPCESGTERIWRALPSLPPAEVIVNLQADEPELPAAWLLECLAAFRAGAPDVVTMALPILAGETELDNPNAVKVVVDHDGFALYFSRCAIPYVRPGGRAPEPRGLRHVGLYAYSSTFLKNYHRLPPSDLELSECLEQLRFLQAAARIKVIVAPKPALGHRGIDTENDYREFVARNRNTI